MRRSVCTFTSSRYSCRLLRRFLNISFTFSPLLNCAPTFCAPRPGHLHQLRGEIRQIQSPRPCRLWERTGPKVTSRGTCSLPTRTPRPCVQYHVRPRGPGKLRHCAPTHDPRRCRCVNLRRDYLLGFRRAVLRFSIEKPSPCPNLNHGKCLLAENRYRKLTSTNELLDQQLVVKLPCLAACPLQFVRVLCHAAPDARPLSHRFTTTGNPSSSNAAPSCPPRSIPPAAPSAILRRESPLRRHLVERQRARFRA